MGAKLKAFLSKLWGEITDTWEKSKMWILGALAVIAAFEWQKIKAALLVYAGKKQIDSAKKEDQTLATEASNANKQADALVQQAQQLPSQQPPVAEDWYENKDNE